MPSFKFDDVEIPFQPGDTVIRAARRAGLDIPHYCWHPGLSVAANCRMCLVELMPPPGRGPLLLDVVRWDEASQTYIQEKKPKLVPACVQACAEGMEVRSQSSEHVAQARSAVQELLLLNHPVDCPICDQAGECRLQDYWLEHQGTPKRMGDELVHKPKAVVFGPTIVYDAERCVMCTRCIRFSAEVAKDPVLALRERGNLNEVTVAPGRQLDHGYTLMTEYVCPVGALTSVDFRFKARVWFLRTVPSVCQGCATGCPAWLDYDPRDGSAYRYRPRENEAEGQYWMCDEGMLDYRRIHEHRVLQASVDGAPADIFAALEAAASKLRGVPPERLAVVLSAEHSNEDNYALLSLARDYLGTGNVFLTGRPSGVADGILRDADRNSNTAGVMALCTSAPPRSFAELAAAVDSGKITHLLSLGSSVPQPEQASCLETLEALVALCVHEGPLSERAQVVLPAASWAEGNGSFVNARGLVQESQKAFSPHGDSVPAWKLVSALAGELGYPMNFKRLADVRRAMAPEPGALSAPQPVRLEVL